MADAAQRHFKSLKARYNVRRNFTAKMADKLTAYFGSISFLVLNLLLFIFWILMNTGVFSWLPVIDPFPYVFLITAVSLEAIFLSIFVLISQSRQTKLDDVREEVILQFELRTQEQNEKMLEMLEKLSHKSGIKSVKKDLKLSSLKKHKSAREMTKEIEAEIEA